MCSLRHRAVITGLGVIAANGGNQEEFCQSLMDGRSGVKHVDLFDVSQFRTPMAGQVCEDMSDLLEDCNHDRTVLLAVRALQEALLDADLAFDDIRNMGNRAGLAFATSHGGTSRVMEHIKQEMMGEDPSPEWLSDLNFFTNCIARKAGIQGPSTTTVTACAAGTGSGGIALDMIRAGRADLMVWGGSDPLMELSYGGFHIMKALSVTGVPKPFDQHRDGLIIGEGAAMMIVERLDCALDRGAHIYAEILGYGISNDAYHATSPDPEGGGAVRAMRMALEDSGLEPQNIDYVNAHGTATLVNDTMELKAIAQVFGEYAYEVPISSTKSMTGHCLGASGSIEAAACLLAIDRQFCPPTATLEIPEEGLEKYNLIRQSISTKVMTIMSNSFAFAGNMACVIFRQYDGENGDGTDVF